MCMCKITTRHVNESPGESILENLSTIDVNDMHLMFLDMHLVNRNL